MKLRTSVNLEISKPAVIAVSLAVLILVGWIFTGG